MNSTKVFVTYVREAARKICGRIARHPFGASTVLLTTVFAASFVNAAYLSSKGVKLYADTVKEEDESTRAEYEFLRATKQVVSASRKGRTVALTYSDVDLSRQWKALVAEGKAYPVGDVQVLDTDDVLKTPRIVSGLMSHVSCVFAIVQLHGTLQGGTEVRTSSDSIKRTGTRTVDSGGWRAPSGDSFKTGCPEVEGNRITIEARPVPTRIRG